MLGGAGRGEAGDLHTDRGGSEALSRGGVARAEPFTIGWIGTPETAPYLDTINGALSQVLAKDNTCLLLVGADQSFLPFHNVEAQPWSEAKETSLLHRMHVGIMPLPDGNWEYGKSGYKLVQFMAVSRPVVAVTSALGSAARETVETSFSLSTTAPKIAEILHSAAALRRSWRRRPSRTAIKSGLARSAGSSGVAPSR
jgi:hypothetical protein